MLLVFCRIIAANGMGEVTEKGREIIVHRRSTGIEEYAVVEIDVQVDGSVLQHKRHDPACSSFAMDGAEGRLR